ncbi:MAG: PQQ-binding-like beta-propeller repeat protein, partial [Kiritimatiellae bacterium]|nr:PQQ-binding-like beta-propeller repeat protein [Kiritimatiellia bacterium]
IQRRGNLDGKPGPSRPEILWVYKAQQHFVASPVPDGGSLFLAGLGAFNTGVFQCFATANDAPQRLLWSKTVPYVKRPTVCPPAVAGGLVVFGDGMHQTDDALLFCLQADTGRPLWQYALPGRLVHIEAAPTIDRGRVYVGAGAAGVLCIELDRAMLEGKEADLQTLKTTIEKAWAALNAKYEEEKKKDPDFAVPPDDDALPKATPKLVWQVGKAIWHVDAPVGVEGDAVYVGSAFLEEEKLGRRALIRLRAGDGSVVWETPLRLNPWAGPTLAGDVVLVACSSIRFDTTRIGRAEGEIVAIETETGHVRWRKSVPGGVLSPVAVAEGLAVFTATDGKIRAWYVADGREKWSYPAKNPFFGGVAIAAGTVFAADLKAVLYAVDLATGKMLWSFDVGGDPSVQLPGMVFGSPVVDGGKIYLATCNIVGTHAGQPSVVVCIGEAGSAAKSAVSAGIAVDKVKRTVTIPCRIAPRKLPTLTDIYPIEVIACYPAPVGQKAHETVVTLEVKPSEVHEALVGFGLKPGRPVKGDDHGPPSGPEVGLTLEFTDPLGITRSCPVEDVLFDTRTGRPLPKVKWHFTGSVLRQADPEKSDAVYGADLTGTLITLFPVTHETVLQSNLMLKDRKHIRPETNKELLPPEGSPAKLVIHVVEHGQQTGSLVDLRPVSRFVPFVVEQGAAGDRNPEELVSIAVDAGLPPIRMAGEPRKLTPLLPAIRLPPMDEPGMEEKMGRPPLPPSPSMALSPLRCASSPDLNVLPSHTDLSEMESGVTDFSKFIRDTHTTDAVFSREVVPRKNPPAFLRFEIFDPFRTEKEVQPDRVPDDSELVPARDGRLLVPVMPTNFVPATKSGGKEKK